MIRARVALPQLEYISTTCLCANETAQDNNSATTVRARSRAFGEREKDKRTVYSDLYKTALRAAGDNLQRNLYIVIDSNDVKMSKQWTQKKSNNNQI